MALARPLSVPSFLLFSMLLLTRLHAGMVVPTAPAAPPAGSAAAYGTSYGTTLSIDQAAFTSLLFWEQLDDALPALNTDPRLERFRGFVHNLRTEAPGETVALANGQELLRQYVFPGLQDDCVEREPFPEHADWTTALEALAPTAQAELADVLAQHPTIADDAPPPAYDDDDDDVAEEVWNRAAWFGWQFLSLRDAKRHMPRTIRALRDSGLPYAHRFVGIARQRPRCCGSRHSDQRNYLMSTLTGLAVPTTGPCGVVAESGAAGAEDEERRLLRDGDAFVLDNTFSHYVYNEADAERFVLMVEMYHPALSQHEEQQRVEIKRALFGARQLATLLPRGAGTACSGWRCTPGGLEERPCRSGPDERPRHGH